jgi:hypothetical protein
VCPLVGCAVPIPQPVLEGLFATAGDGQGAAVLARRRQLQAQALVDAGAGVRWCPVAGCGRSVTLPAGARGLGVGVVCGCGRSFCFGCGAAPAHDPASCGEWAEFGLLLAERRAADSEDWIAANTTRCRRCRTPIQRTFGCNHMRCTRCTREFCYVCGDDWDPAHYGCFQRRAAHGTDDDAPAAPAPAGEGPAPGPAAAPAPADVAAPVPAAEPGDTPAPAALAAPLSREEDERRLRCSAGHASWSAVEQGGLAPEEWARLCGEDQAALPVAGAVLSAAQAAVRRGAGAMACSYAMEWGVPPGVRHMRARKRLHGLREGLERDLHTLAGVLAAPPGAAQGAEGGSDLREPMGLAAVLEDRAALRQRVEELRSVVAERTARLLTAGRARGWSAATGTRETAVFLAGEGLAVTKRVMGELVRDGARRLGLNI